MEPPYKYISARRPCTGRCGVGAAPSFSQSDTADRAALLEDSIESTEASCIIRMPPNITRIKILVSIFASYIWDAMREGYIERCRREYEEHYYRGSSVRRLTEDDQELRFDQRVHPDDPDYDEISYYDDRNGEPDLDCSEEQQRNELAQLIDREFDCPLPTKPRWIRMYQIFSNCFVVYGTIKYAFLSSLYYEWLHIDKTYACYIPGRLGLTADVAYEVPWFGFLIFACHVAWRLIMYCNIKQLNLDVFMFLLYDKEVILDRQFEIEQSNSSNLSPREAYRRYLCNKVFYEHQVDSRGRSRYMMKKHRTMDHYERMESVNILFKLWCALTVILSIPVFIVALRNQLSHEFFDLNYSECRSFADSPNTTNFKWSFSDKFRLMNLFFDRLDDMMIAIDTTINLVLPFVLVTLSHDLTLRLEDLCARVSALNDRFRNLVFNDDLVRAMFAFTEPTMKFINDLEKESRGVFNEVIDTFNQVECEDEFMRRFTLILVYVWFLVTMSGNVFILVRMGTLKDSSLMVYMIAEFYWHTAMASLLALMTRPHNRAKILYNRLCSAMALCPTKPEAKVTWQWLVEYYHKDSSRYSLHFVAKSYALSNLNIIRCMSWFVSCTVIMVNLIRNRLPVRT